MTYTEYLQEEIAKLAGKDNDIVEQWRLDDLRDALSMIICDPEED